MITTITSLVRRVLDQSAARVIVAPQQGGPGCWFGGGNMTEGPDGRLYLVGRYRNPGDSRTGLAAGPRGFQLSVLAADQEQMQFEPLLRFTKADLAFQNRPVLSIEGAALFWDRHQGVELFVSVEQQREYPEIVRGYQKSGTGVWRILRLYAADVEGLSNATPQLLLESQDPEHLHVKDPFVYRPADAPPDDVWLGFCTHPFSWTSSNTGIIQRRDGVWGDPNWCAFPRGATWDVAITRATCIADLPRVGVCADRPWSLVLYDGGECVRSLEQHRQAVERPRGYSCEELGGAAVAPAGDLSLARRLSALEPLMVSPWGTGCSRYAHICTTSRGWYATWQQSQPDRSQSLVMQYTPLAQVESLLQPDPVQS